MRDLPESHWGYTLKVRFNNGSKAVYEDDSMSWKTEAAAKSAGEKQLASLSDVARSTLKCNTYFDTRY